ncbi:DNA repair protein SWI5 homolog [Exaiptasia diaphana]|uniref:DNA repair protein SWI5 homolog n=1 Tax=Exaiptasia diaphana TaxID=2652724 RepID=A0A913Y1Y5_EXADI|nr:DNA repair protein SWI5 homolog [Exaiptasia diaphana]XP_020913222.1 DNA repair protein SWI5 homolog [Exaiptasia diaphana]XP_020913224.1 DNA repair protein SWI5 homolog [Exaiptasia diaphana]KXJ29188.1 DNA repair protein SWI5-like [Exaiptasia diaphana]
MNKPSGGTPLPGKRPISNQRTPRSGMRLKQPFKSPVHAKEQSTSPKLSRAQEMLILQRKIESLDEEISLLQQEYDVDELQEHIDKLHEYNDIKDVGQMLIGKLAEIDGKTTKSLYEEFGLDIDD